MLNYLKFIHKVIKFIEASVNNSELIAALENNLIEELELFDSFL